MKLINSTRVVLTYSLLLFFSFISLSFPLYAQSNEAKKTNKKYDIELIVDASNNSQKLDFFRFEIGGARVRGDGLPRGTHKFPLSIEEGNCKFEVDEYHWSHCSSSLELPNCATDIIFFGYKKVIMKFVGGGGINDCRFSLTYL